MAGIAYPISPSFLRVPLSVVLATPFVIGVLLASVARGRKGEVLKLERADSFLGALRTGVVASSCFIAFRREGVGGTREGDSLGEGRTAWPGGGRSMDDAVSEAARSGVPSRNDTLGSRLILIEVLEPFELLNRGAGGKRFAPPAPRPNGDPPRVPLLVLEPPRLPNGVRDPIGRAAFFSLPLTDGGVENAKADERETGAGPSRLPVICLDGRDGVLDMGGAGGCIEVVGVLMLSFKSRSCEHQAYSIACRGSCSDVVSNTYREGKREEEERRGLRGARLDW